MIKLLFLLILLFPLTANATQITYGTTYAPNGQVTSTNLNGNFNNVSSVVNGKLDNTNADTTNGYRFYKTVSVLPSPGSQGAVYFLTTDNSLNFDTGAAFNKSVSINAPSSGGLLYYNSGWNNVTIGASHTLLSSDGSVPSFGYTVGTSASNIVQLDGSSKMPAVDGSALTSLTGANVVSPLGAWTASNTTFGTAYQATTDGYVMGTCTNSGSSSTTIQILTDSANPPTTARCTSAIGANTGGTLSCFSPVKKNDYYKIAQTNGCTVSQSGYFIPIGS